MEWSRSNWLSQTLNSPQGGSIVRSDSNRSGWSGKLLRSAISMLTRNTWFYTSKVHPSKIYASHIRLPRLDQEISIFASVSNKKAPRTSVQDASAALPQNCQTTRGY